MDKDARPSGFSTMLNHLGEGGQTANAHITPIFQTSSFRFPDVDTGAAIFQGEQPGYYYTRIENPNHLPVVQKVAAMEAWDLWKDQPEVPVQNLVDGYLFASGMAAVSAALLSSLKSGDTLIAQKNIYGATYNLLKLLSEQHQIQVVWLPTGSPDEWEKAFQQNPQARLAYAETPANPTLSIVDLEAAAQVTHQYQARLIVDNTFATPYCQRPFNFGADVVLHSTTKYLGGHGVIIGGIVLSKHLDWVKGPLFTHLKLFGASASPFDAWLTQLGLKTFELRMQQHCTNALQIAQWLQYHPRIERVYYPGLPQHKGHALAKKQMIHYGGMIAFEVLGGLSAGKTFMNNLKILTLATSLGNADSLVQHPASMSHVNVPREERLESGISDGLIRLSVGIENTADLMADLDQALNRTIKSEQHQ